MAWTTQVKSEMLTRSHCFPETMKQNSPLTKTTITIVTIPFYCCRNELAYCWPGRILSFKRPEKSLGSAPSSFSVLKQQWQRTSPSTPELNLAPCVPPFCHIFLSLNILSILVEKHFANKPRSCRPSTMIPKIEIVLLTNLILYANPFSIVLG